MKNKIIITTFALFGVVGGYLLTTQMEVDYSNPVLAVDEAALTTISTGCTDPLGPTAYAPNTITYTIVPSDPNEDNAPTATASGLLDNGVNAQSTTMNSVTAAPDTGVGRVVIDSEGPFVKVAGLQCRTAVFQSTLEVFSDAGDTVDFDVAFSNIAQSTYDAADKADARVTANPLVIFGSYASGSGGAGTVSISPIADNADADAGTGWNGEVLFGGVTEAEGAYSIISSVDWTNSNVATGTHVETFTYRFALTN